MFELTTFSVIVAVGVFMYFRPTLSAIFGRTENTATLVVNTTFDVMEKSTFLASKTSDTALVAGLNGLSQLETVAGITEASKADALAQFEAFRGNTVAPKPPKK